MSYDASLVSGNGDARRGRNSCSDTIAIIVAAGSGTRFGKQDRKQFVELCGRPLLAWPLIAFDSAASIAGIVVVCPTGLVNTLQAEVLDPLQLKHALSIVEGGASRQDSVLCGIKGAEALAPITGTNPRFFAVHDGARPLVSADTIEQVIAVLRGDDTLDGAIAATRVTDTLKRVHESRMIAATVERSCLWSAMTPQVFRSDVLSRAYALAADSCFTGTDDASLVEHMGGHVRCVSTPRDNLKVTYPEDLALAAALLRARLMDDSQSECL